MSLSAACGTNVVGLFVLPESQSQWLIVRHGSINVVPASVGLKTTDQTCHYEQWLCGPQAQERRVAGRRVIWEAVSAACAALLSLLTAQTSCPTRHCGLAQLFFFVILR